MVQFLALWDFVVFILQSWAFWLIGFLLYLINKICSGCLRYISDDDVVDCQIDERILSSVLSSTSPDSLSQTDCYLCGPTEMIDAVDNILLRIGLKQSQIKYEKWW